MPEHNSYYRDRERAGRPRGGRPSEPRQKGGDSLALTLTAQVIVVLLLFASVWILRSVNREGYYAFRESYGYMTGAQSELEHGTSPLDEISRFIEQFTGGSDLESEPEPDIDEGQFYLSDQDYLPPPGQSTPSTEPLIGTDESGLYIIPEGAVVSPVVFSAQMQPPVTGRITSPFGWRLHPVTQAANFHNGIDVAAPEGTPILAALSGNVAEIGWSRVYGHYIVLGHAANFKTFYAHCKEIIVSEGMGVSIGEKIATVGSTGITTGPHLHFGVIVDGKYINPYWALTDSIIVRR